MTDVRRVARFVRNHPWALLPEKLDAICELLEMRARGITLTEEEVRLRVDATAGPRDSVRLPMGAANEGTIAIIPLYGVLAQKMNLMTAISGGTSMQQFIAQVREAVNDAAVKTIVVDCDTPGGTVEGCIETADQLFALRGPKPIIAVANPKIASAGYWIASQADKVVAAPSASIGAIGVFYVHEDLSKANEMEGRKPTYVYAGAHKVEGNPDEALSDEAKAHIQGLVNERYRQFVAAVARGRKISVADVEERFGQGRTLFAEEAVRAGMADRIGTLEQILGELMSQHQARATSRTVPLPRGGQARAQAQMPEPMQHEPGEEHPDMAPDEQGLCPAGYEKGEDGMCHWMEPEMEAARRAEQDALAIASALGE